MIQRRPDKDRRLRQNVRLGRLLNILQLIQARSRWNVRTLAAELVCSERTVYRDLVALQLAGVPWHFDKTERCYRVRPDYRFPVLNLSEEELLGQAVATAVMRAPGLNVGPGAEPTTRKLAAASGEKAQQILADASQLVAVLDLKLADHSRHQEVIRTAQWALLQRKQLVGQYASPYQEKPIALHLHPYRLCLIKQAWYLIGRPTKEEQPRTYRITRFKTLRMVDAAAEIPADFDLQTYLGDAWGVYRGNKTYDVAIVFTKESAPLVTETIWHHTQKVQRQPDGSFRLTFRVDGLNEILHWVLGWAGRARVIEPPELRTMVLDQLREAVRMNEA